MAKKRHVEPRTRQDRERIRAKKKKKGRKKLFIFFLFVMFIGVLVTLSLTVFFMIENITVVGNEKYSADEITSLIQIQKGENLFRIDTKSAKQNIEKTLPYIDSVTVKRKLPSTLQIDVTECKVAYKIDIDNGCCLLLNQESKVLEYSDSSKDYVMLEVVGLDASGYQIGQKLTDLNGNKTQIVFDILQVLLDNNIDNIKFIDIKNESDIRLNYKGNIRVLLGDSHQLEEKILFLKGVLKKIHESETGVLDVRNTQKAYFNSHALEQALE